MANAGGPYTGTVGIAVSFSGAGSTDPQGEPLTYAWDFGDSTTGSTVSPVHTYTASGTYTVSLTVTNTNHLVNTASTKADISVASPGSLSGIVSTGARPISGAHVYLLAANITGYGHASVSLLNASRTGTSDALGAYVATSSNGAFNLTGDYACTPGQQLYLYASGGDSGSGANPLSGLMAVIGTCPGNLAPAIFAMVNEVTTVAAAYTMAGFAADATHVSSSGSPLALSGVANAFANAGNLVSLSTGVALSTTPGGNGTVPQALINTVADILATCVDSGCALVTIATSDGTPTGTQPADSASAAINIAHVPAANVSALYAIASSVYSPKLLTPPNDLAMALVYTGGSLFNISGLAIDGSGNVWLSGQSITKLSSAGAVLSGSSGYTGGGMYNPTSIAIDPSGNVWVGNNNYSVSELSSSGAGLSPSSTGYPNPGQIVSYNIAIDGYGNVWDGNSGNGLTEFSSAGSILADYSIDVYLSNSVAIDGSGNVWASENGNNAIAKISSLGVPLSGASGFTGGGLDFPGFMAVDGSGGAWIANPSVNSVTRLSSTGSSLSGASGYTGGGLNNPSCIAIDGAGNAWIADAPQGNFSSSIVEISNGGTFLSGANGYVSPLLPLHIAIDGSGDVWIAGAQSIAEIIGSATPVVTPLSVGAKNNAVGARP
ncbi:MAG: PKD domain-containing protein [Acidobacteriaceae bacterium]